MLRVTIIPIIFALVHGESSVGLSRSNVYKPQVPIEKHPYVLSFSLFGSYSGTAVLINPDVALTAGYLSPSAGDYVRLLAVRAGTATPEIYEGSSPKTDGEVAIMATVCQDPKFENTSDHAISVIHLHPAFNISDRIRPIELHPLNFEAPTGSAATISGFDSLRPPPRLATLKREIVTKIEEDRCKEAYLEENLTDRAFCFGLQSQADAGAPLVIDGKLAGIKAWYTKDPDGNLPGLYVKISSADIYRHIVGCMERFQATNATLASSAFISFP